MAAAHGAALATVSAVCGEIGGRRYPSVLQKSMVVITDSMTVLCVFGVFRPGDGRAMHVNCQWSGASAVGAHACNAAAASFSSFCNPIMVCAVLFLITEVSALMAATATARSGCRASASWNSLMTMSLRDATGSERGGVGARAKPQRQDGWQGGEHCS